MKMKLEDRTAVITFLLAEDALARTADGNPLPQRALDGPIGVRDRRCIGLA